MSRDPNETQRLLDCVRGGDQAVFEQLSEYDMAQLLHITEAAAGKRYIRAVERLRKILLDLGVSNPAR
jgi:hypothetical protein